MKILMDAGVGNLSAAWLTAAGHEVLSVATLDPEMSDEAILDLAVHEERLVVTMDKDFGELVFRDTRAHAGVVLLRLDDASAPERRDTIASLFTQHAARLPGRFSVFQKGQLRTRT